jgi:hypothetical protein
LLRLRQRLPLPQPLLLLKRLPLLRLQQPLRLQPTHPLRKPPPLRPMRPAPLLPPPPLRPKLPAPPAPPPLPPPSNTQAFLAIDRPSGRFFFVCGKAGLRPAAAA